MKFINQYSKFFPYLYFITIIVYWFTEVNQTQGITAYLILLFGVPFLWQLIKPNKNLNFILGTVFICLSSYLILAYLSDILNIISFKGVTKNFALFDGLFVISNFIMAAWIIRNSLRRSF